MRQFRTLALSLILLTLNGPMLWGQGPTDSLSWDILKSVDGSMPVARHEAAYVKAGSLYYLLGGRRVQAVSIYDPARQVWSKGEAPPIEMHHFQPIVWEGKIWVGGALSGRYPGEVPLEHFYIYDPKLDLWEKGPALPADRLRGSTGTVVYQDKIYLVCGISDGHRSLHRTWLDEYDPKTNQWRQLPDAPRPRDHFQATVAGNKLYVLGGRRSKAPKNVFGDTEGKVDVFDFETEVWTTLDAELPTPRAGSFNAFYDDHILVLGGESGTTAEAHPQVEALDVATQSFETWAPLSQARHGTGAIVDGEMIFVASGNGSRGGGNELTQQECLRPQSMFRTYSLDDLFIRDPFILPVEEEQTYYLFSGTDAPWETTGLTQGVVAYTSKDLQSWTGPQVVYQSSPRGWADPWQEVWAPEVHAYQGKYYLFATQSNPWRVLPKQEDRPAQFLRATDIAVADHPLGPFRPLSERPQTPLDWMSLDGTLWVEAGQPWMVFCHEWHQVTDGTFELVALEKDLSSPIGEPKTLFSASEAKWSREMKSLGFNVKGWVSDGPWLHRNKNGDLLMLWSSFGENRYTVGLAKSKSGTIQGPWDLLPEPFFAQDGGHGMLFRRFDGQLMFTCHSPNRSPLCRTQLFEVKEKKGSLKLGRRVSP